MKCKIKLQVVIKHQRRTHSTQLASDVLREPGQLQEARVIPGDLLTAEEV